MLSSSMRWKRKSKITAKQSIILLTLIIISIIPLLLKNEGVISKNDAHRSITIVTTHDVATCHEFEKAFTTWWAENTGGELIHIDWISIRHSTALQYYIDNEHSKLQNIESTEKQISSYDIVFGGEVGDMEHFKSRSYTQPLDVFKDLSYLFAKDSSGETSMPQSWQGAQLYDPDQHWAGLSLSRYGICYNKELLKDLGIDSYPTSWMDLTQEKYFNQILLADPNQTTLNASVFEMMLQSEMQKSLKANNKQRPGETPQEFKERITNNSWKQGLELIQKITANAKTYTSNIHDVAKEVYSGEVAIGVCPDYIARAYQTKATDTKSKESRIEFIVPEKGSSLMVSPIAISKYSKYPDLANGFVKFCMLPEGQLLWNTHAGNELIYGPEKSPLRRLPIRRDIYTEDYRVLFTDPDDRPYDKTVNLHYDEKLTGHLKLAIPYIIKCMSVDVHTQQKEAWRAIFTNQLHKNPNTTIKIHFHDLNKVSYTKAVNDFAPNLTNIQKKVTLNEQLQDIERNKNSEEIMKKYYPNASSESYPELLSTLKNEVSLLNSIDLFYLEDRQRRLSSQFRGSYKKTIINAKP